MEEENLDGFTPYSYETVIFTLGVTHEKACAIGQANRTCKIIRKGHSIPVPLTCLPLKSMTQLSGAGQDTN